MADMYQVYRRYDLANIPVQYRDWRFDNVEPKEHQERFFEVAKQWYEDRLTHITKFAEDGSVERAGDGVGLIFAGQAGIGKTALASMLANEILDRRALVWFTTVQGLNDLYFTQLDLREAWGKIGDEEAYAEWRDHELWLEQVRETMPLLVLDDLGRERRETRSDWLATKLETLLRSRYHRGLPTIITTNLLGFEDWAEHYERASLTSFIREGFISTPVSGSDIRKEQA